MKRLLTIVLLLIQTAAFASTLDSIAVNNEYLYFHKITTSKDTTQGLIIYMHGGVSQFKGLAHPKPIPATDLLEGNTDFIPTATQAGYDVILPIAYNEYNWLNDTGEQFIDRIIMTYGKTYARIIISGFSDGGTGAYRFFYHHPGVYEGLLLFNGYPQLGNYYKKVKHYDGRGKNIIYASCTADKVIPYEFLMVEYRRQKILNKNTFFLLTDGGHSFSSYTKQHLQLCMELLSKKHDVPSFNNAKKIYPPIDGLIIDGELKQVYSFRKKIAKRYSMAATEYENGAYIYKTYSKLLAEHANITLSPLTIDITTIDQMLDFDFDITINGNNENINLTNWLNVPTW